MAENVLEIILKAEVDNATKAIENFAKTVGVEVKGAVSVYEAFNKKIKEIESTLKASKSPAEVARLTLELKKTQEAFGSIKAGNFSTKLTEVSKNSNSASFAVLNLGRVAQDASFGFIGIANNIEPLIQSITALKASTTAGSSATKAFFSALAGPAGIGVLIGAISLFDAYSNGYGVFANKAKEAKKAQADFNDELDKAKVPALSAGLQLQQFVNIAANAKLPIEQRNKALDEGNKILGDYGTKLTLANVATAAITAQTNLFTQALIQEAVAGKLADRLADTIIKQSDASVKFGEANKALANEAKKATNQLFGLGVVLNSSVFSSGAGLFNIGNATAFQNSLSATNAEGRNYINLTKERVKQTDEANKAQAESTRLFGLLGTGANAAAAASKNQSQALKEVSQSAEDAQKNFDALIAPIKNLTDSLSKPEPISITTQLNTAYRELQEIISGILTDEQKIVALQQEKLILAEKAKIAANIAAVPTTAAAKLTENVAPVTIGTEAADKEKERARLANLTAINNKVADIKNGFATLAPIVDAAFNALSGGENAVEGLKQAVKSLIIQLLKAAALAAIISIATGGAAGGGTSFLTAFKGILGFKAQGGTVNSGSPYIVGENGPELFVPTGSGNIVSNGRFGNAGGGGGTLSARVSGGDLLFILNQAGRNRSVNFG